MFYASLALLQKIGKTPSKHTGVITLFDTEFVMKGVFEQRLSKGFHRAFIFRQNADYRIMDSPTTEEARDVLRSAARFVAAVKDYLA